MYTEYNNNPLLLSFISFTDNKLNHFSSKSLKFTVPLFTNGYAELSRGVT